MSIPVVDVIPGAWAGDPVEAVRDDPELYAVEYRIDFGSLQHAGQRQGRKGQLP